MISVKYAQKLILNNFDGYNIGKVKVLDSLGYVLSENIISPDKLPRFDQSAMDGYAIKSEDTKENELVKLKTVRNIYPGDNVDKFYLKNTECAYITTGSPLPKGTDAVIPVEYVKINNAFVEIKRKVYKGENVRKSGEDINTGKIVASKGEVITPQIIGLFAALGITFVKVFLPPKIGIITTGSELVSSNKKISKYQIRNSNLWTLKALLKSIDIIPVFTRRFTDKKNIVYQFLKNLKTLPDIVILTGGVSVGRHDYVKNELEKFKVKQLFWGVSQKPGKPLYCASKKGKIFFGLPGNPGAVITCFYLYVLPVINKYLHKSRIFLPKISAILKNNVRTDEHRTLFLRGCYKNGSVQLLEGQGSHMLFSFSKANSLVIIEPQKKFIYKKGKKVPVLLLI